MRHLILVGLLAAAAAPLVAQVAPAPPPGARAMMAKTMTRAEVQTGVQAAFARRDANRDGFLTNDELAMRGGAERGMRDPVSGGEPMPGTEPMRDPNVAFDRLDTNRDGSISRDEFARGRQVRVERIVINRSEEPGSSDMHGMPGGHRGNHHGGGGGGGGAMMGAAMLKMADANRDGKVSLAEATAGALRHFDMIDANRDGRLTPEERQAGRARMMQMRKAG